ncbi:MAG: GNAT family N-acetyltransferase, partial [Flavobacteriales bacterium]|nr:GNAT family N-acetyltransferase [Flavobacteriales bacterium]
MESITVRPSTSEDMPGVLRLIRELAEYERALDEVEMTVEQLQSDGFGKNPLFEILVAESTEIVGLALFYPRYSTWKGRTLFLEDLVVAESHRRMGVGKML